MKDKIDAAMSAANGPLGQELKAKCKDIMKYSRSSQQTSEEKGAVKGPRSVNYFREFICGWGAASINITMTFPINKVMFRQQLYGISSRHALRQLRKEGALRLYRGMLPPLMQKTAAMSIMFGMYHKYQEILLSEFTGMPVVGAQVTAAVLAGCTEAILTPFERVQTLMQDKHYHKHFKNTIHTLVELRSYGVSEFYRGLTPILLRNGPSNAIFFVFRGRIREKLPPAKTESGEVFYNFVSGGVLGATISTMFFPINVVKTQMQAKVGGNFTGLVASFWMVFNERNRSWREMFRGVHVNYTRSIISWGIINASYELLKHYYFSNDS